MKQRPIAQGGVTYQVAACSVVCNSPVQVQPVVVMQEVCIDSLQQQVRTIWVESQEVFVFLWGGGVPLHAWDLDWGPRVVSLSSSSPSSTPSGSCSSDASSFAALASWPSLCRLWLLRVGGRRTDLERVSNLV